MIVDYHMHLRGPHGELAHSADAVEPYVEQARAAGVEVAVSGLPPDAQLPGEVEETALRVVQEGLTNAVRHAPGSPVRVRLDLEDETLSIEVRDDGAALATTLGAAGSGSGLEGMRERVESLGGNLTTVSPGRGWILRAELPLPARTPSG